jgi:hypothetical protein
MPLKVAAIEGNYEEFMDEMLARVPVHDPEWTEFNDVDPGISLLQLFAFLSESILHRYEVPIHKSQPPAGDVHEGSGWLRGVISVVAPGHAPLLVAVATKSRGDDDDVQGGDPAPSSFTQRSLAD